MTTVPERTATSGDESDEDASAAQAQIIASLRAQVTDLFSQVTQLNGKLVSSYDRVSGLEDQLHDTSSSLRNASVTISSLELERSHHLAALNTGLLVEKAHVTAELNRLMERATEEAAQRGQAETARLDIEKDLDDLSATLFDQANTMVAEARLNQARSERKVQDAEQALKIAEDAVKDMQVQMQSLQAEKETAERDAQEARFTMGKGKWIEGEDSRVGGVPGVRFMTTHAPYFEFLAFVAHLRGLRVSQPTSPAIPTLLSQPFIARLLTEDSEPTVRLDLAPSLNWLSRRSVLAAIHTGMLTVEPLPFSSLVQELHQHPQLMSTSSLSCALCGTLIARLSSTTPTSRSNSTNGSSWFKYPLALGSTQNHSAGTLRSTECEPPGQIYIFRLALGTTSAPPPNIMPVHTSSVSMSVVGTSSRPHLNTMPSPRISQAQTQHIPYPLCTSNYCLTRLRSTCSLWAFVRVGVVERIWEEEVVHPPKSVVNGDSLEKLSPLATSSTGNQNTSGTALPLASEKPPVPPRRRRLWEMASALGERAVSWGKESGETTKEKETEKDGTKKLHIPPPSHPSAPHPHAEPRVDAQDPPPLPKRNVVHDIATTDAAVLPSEMQNGTTAPEVDEPAANANDVIDSDKTDANASDPATPLDETIFNSPTPEASPVPFTTSHPVAAEPSAPPAQDHPPPPSPHTVPLPMTPTVPNPISRVASPIPRSRSRLSSPASPPPSSRPASPAVNRSRAGSPAPAGTARGMSPLPGHPPSASHIRGKLSMPSPLAPSRLSSSVSTTTTGPGAPPLPRRAAARRAVPLPPPTSKGPNVAGEGDKEEEVSPVIMPDDVTPDMDVCKANEGDVPAETQGAEGAGAGEEETRDGVKEATVDQDASLPATTLDTTEVGLGSAKDVAVDDADVGHGYVEGTATGTPASVVPDPLPPRSAEGDGRTSVDTTSTKQSSTTESSGFASDATWEERTWKELVRLKEDMFWARIGGMRGP